MPYFKPAIFCVAAFVALTLFPWAARAQQVTMPSMHTPSGYVALLLINEVPFPGETAYVSEQNSKHAMLEILAVLVNRLHEIPHPYTQREVAGIRTQNILDIITVGGVGGQVQGFFRNNRGEYVVLPRVSRRAQHLLMIANQGTPGTFARLIDFAANIAEGYIEKKSAVEDLFASLRTVSRVPVTGRTYAWMTNIHHINPGGNYVVIPRHDRGTLGGNRFFTLRREQK